MTSSSAKLRNALSARYPLYPLSVNNIWSM
nr:MAG TPA: hypothetical protein [Caudoviricetes sp.]